VAAYEALTSEQREDLQVDLGFATLPLSALSGMRLSEAAQHSWDARVAFESAAAIPESSAQILAEHFAGGLAFMTGFIGKADALAKPAAVEIQGSPYGIVVADGVSFTEGVANPTASFVGPLESAIRLLGGRLTPAHTPAGVEVIGDLTLDDLRKVFPGF
jgi:hypothetical protein